MKPIVKKLLKQRLEELQGQILWGASRCRDTERDEIAQIQEALAEDTTSTPAESTPVDSAGQRE